MKRDELLEDIRKGVCEALPDNVEIDSDNVDDVETVVNSILDDAKDAVDEDDDDEEAVEGKE